MTGRVRPNGSAAGVSESTSPVATLASAWALTLVAGLVVTAGQATTALATPAGYSVTGVDVSNHQGTIDWARVASSGQRFAYAKATEGVGFIDPYYAVNYPAAKHHGLYVGGYHFARPDRGTGNAQADYFLDRSGYVDDGRTLPPMLDIEWPWEGSGSAYPCYGLTPAQLVTWIRAFVDRVRERIGRRPAIYTNVNWWNPCTASSTSFGDHPLVVARYASTPGTLPAGWSRFTFWQYTSSATVPGIIGQTDHNVFNGSVLDLAQLAGGHAWPGLLGDFDGDGHGDPAVWRPSDGTWWVSSWHGGHTTVQWGIPGDVPLVGDFNRDGRADYVIWRPSTGRWWIRFSDGSGGVNNFLWGQPGDIPLKGDFNRDGRDDYAVWRPSTGGWWITFSNGRGGFYDLRWGQAGDIPLAANVSADADAEFVIWRPSTGTWWVLSSNGCRLVVAWGLPADSPLLGDVGGDKHDDFTVWRPSTGQWRVQLSDGSGPGPTIVWGEPADIPV